MFGRPHIRQGLAAAVLLGFLAISIVASAQPDRLVPVSADPLVILPGLMIGQDGMLPPYAGMIDRTDPHLLAELAALPPERPGHGLREPLIFALFALLAACGAVLTPRIPRASWPGLRHWHRWHF